MIASPGKLWLRAQGDRPKSGPAIQTSCLSARRPRTPQCLAASRGRNARRRSAQLPRQPGFLSYVRCQGVTAAACLVACVFASGAGAAPPRGPGDPVESFGSKSRVSVPLARSITPAIALAPRPTGGPLISAETGTTGASRRTTLIALTRAGRTDRSFAGGRLDLGLGATISTTHGDDIFTASSLPGGGLRIRKLTAAGLPEADFGVGGIAEVPANDVRTPQALAVGGDGKIVVTSSTAPPPGDLATDGALSVIRLSADGQLDRGFARGGEHVSAFGGTPGGLGILRDGRITVATVVSGAAVAHPEAISTILFRLTKDGRLDKTFGPPRGFVQVSATYGALTHFALDRQARPLLAGSENRDPDTEPSEMVVRRYTADGQADLGFAESGSVTLPAGGRASADASALALDRAGRILVAGNQYRSDARGYTTFRGVVVRLTPGGHTDRTFGRAGVVRGHVGTPWSSLVAQGNRITLGGAPGPGGTPTSRYELIQLIGGSDRASPQVRITRSCRGRRITVRVADASPLRTVRVTLDSGRTRTSRDSPIRIRATRAAHRVTIEALDIAGNRRRVAVRLRRCR